MIACAVVSALHKIVRRRPRLGHLQSLDRLKHLEHFPSKVSDLAPFLIEAWQVKIFEIQRLLCVLPLG